MFAKPPPSPLKMPVVFILPGVVNTFDALSKVNPAPEANDPLPSLNCICVFAPEGTPLPVGVPPAAHVRLPVPSVCR